jgi:short subunit dehydrogenase-like uncharacterized protein
MSDWLIYGATGYTGALIAREALRLGLSPIIAGRSALAIEALGKELGLRARVILLDDPATIASNLNGIDLVLNCAGPFSKTAEPMMAACLLRRAHYLDITGEIEVFERAHAHNEAAKAAGIVVCSGVGFDVIPTDCVAAMLKDALPGATHLALGFDGAQTLSPGTAKTMVENLSSGGKIRRNGTIVSVPFGYGIRRIDFGAGPATAMAIPWGDVATAFYTTGIPNITVYARTTRSAAILMRVLSLFRFLFRSRTLRGILTERINASVHGPSEAVRTTGTTRVWGEARDGLGHVERIRLTTVNPYTLTVDGALGVVRRLLTHPAPAGSTTPARLMGSSFVLDLPGTKLEAQPVRYAMA